MALIRKALLTLGAILAVAVSLVSFVLVYAQGAIPEDDTRQQEAAETGMQELQQHETAFLAAHGIWDADYEPSGVQDFCLQASGADYFLAVYKLDEGFAVTTSVQAELLHTSYSDDSYMWKFCDEGKVRPIEVEQSEWYIPGITKDDTPVA